ncbi:MAG: hypothetical protein Q4C87_06920 [Actinomycetaceae bacterium]|nr:hypothetical protein [Actinomycetaceae bacterium]
MTSSSSNGSAFGLNRPEVVTEFPPEVYEDFPNALPPSAIVGLPTGRPDLANMAGRSAMEGSRNLIDAIHAAKLDEIPELNDDVAERLTARLRAILLGIRTHKNGLSTSIDGTLTPETVEILLPLMTSIDPSESLEGITFDNADDEPPVGEEEAQEIAECLVEMDLLEAQEGRMVLTAEGRYFAHKPLGLANYVASRIPLALSEFEYEATLLQLIATVSLPPAAEAEERYRHATDAEKFEALQESYQALHYMLEGLGWEEEGEPIEGPDVFGAAIPTMVALEILGFSGWPWRGSSVGLAFGITDDFRIFLGHVLRGSFRMPA